MSKNHFYKYVHIYILLLPMFVWFLLFNYKPIYGLIVAFQDYSPWKGILGSKFTGLQNFITLIDNPYFLRSVKNTVLLSLLQMFIGFPIPIILALMFNEFRNSIFKRSLQTMVFLPHFVSDVVMAGIVITFLSPSVGILNNVLDSLGFERTYFLARSEWFRPIYITSNIWKEAGFGSIVYTAAMAAISPDLYEAARIDGASRLRQAFSITLAGIAPTIITMLIIRIGNIFTVGFQKVILLYQPSTYETSDILSTYVYRTGILQGDYGLATAGGLFESVIAFIFVVAANRISRRTRTSLW